MVFVGMAVVVSLTVASTVWSQEPASGKKFSSQNLSAGAARILAARLQQRTAVVGKVYPGDPHFGGPQPEPPTKNFFIPNLDKLTREPFPLMPNPIAPPLPKWVPRYPINPHVFDR